MVVFNPTSWVRVNAGRRPVKAELPKARHLLLTNEGPAWAWAHLGDAGSHPPTIRMLSIPPGGQLAVARARSTHVHVESTEDGEATLHIAGGRIG